MEKVRILMADDSMFMRNTIKKALGKALLTDIIEAKDGEEALELYKEHKPQIVLLDITMPKKSGLEVLKEIKKMDPDTIVIMCSAIGQESTVMEAMKNGAAEFIVKPFKEAKIIEVMQNYI